MQRYRNRVSGPLLDRIDMHVEVPRLSFGDIQGPAGECSADVRRRVGAAHVIQLERNPTLNSRLTQEQIDRTCALETADRLLLQQAMERLQLSARAFHRILKLARTIADLAASAEIRTAHVMEAISYRRLDRTA